MKNMKFYEVCGGRMAREVQQAFVKAQDGAYMSRRKTEIAIRIIVSPPDEECPDVSQIGYEVALKLPAKRGVRSVTLKDGRAQSDGVNIEKILSEELKITDGTIAQNNG